PWLSLLAHPQAWAFAIGKFLTDSMWWFYITWFPNFLNEKYKLDLKHLGIPLIIIYTMAAIGGIMGGWVSSAMIKRGASINAGRKTALLISALTVTPMIFAQYANNMWTAVFIMGLATASHQAFSSNLY